MKKGFLLLLAVFSFQYLLAQNLEPKQKKNKWGYSKTNSNKFAIKAKFDAALPFGKMLDSNRAFVRSGSNYGVIDAKGKWLVKPIYDSIFEQKKIGEAFVLAKKGEDNFILSKKGEIISEGFKSLEPLNKEVFIFSKNKQLGLMLRRNDKYELILPAEYDNLGAVNFNNNLFFVRKEGKVKFYEFNSKKFSEEYDKYSSIRVRDTGNIRERKTYMVVEKNKKKGLLDEKMNLLIAIEYNDINRFRVGNENEVLFEINKERKKGLIDDTGKTILAAEFDAIYHNQSYFVAMKNGLFGCYDYNGKQILSHLYEDIRFWKEQNLFLVTKEKKQGLVSTEEKVVLPLLYTDLSRITYQNPTYIVSIKDNKKSIWVFEENKIEKIHKDEFEDIRFLENNPTLVIIKSKNKENVFAVENKQLKKLYKNDYDKIEKFNKEYYLVRNKGKNHLLDKKSEKLFVLPEYSLLKDSEDTYQVGRKEHKKYTEGQEEGTFYIEQENKAFFWNVKTQKLAPTEKVKPFEKEKQNEDKIEVEPKTKPKKENQPNKKPRKK